MTCNKHIIYTIMPVLGNRRVKLRCQQGNSGKQNPERGKRTVKQIRLWSTTSFKSKLDLLESLLTCVSELRLSWVTTHYKLTNSLAKLRLPSPTPTLSTGQLADNNQQLKRNVKDNVKLYCNTRYDIWFSSVLLIM